MQIKRIATIMTVVVALTLILATSSTVAGPPVEGGQGSAGVKLAGTVASKISYQGRLTDAAGNPLNGNYNLVFQLWDDATAGSQVGGDIVRNSVPVSNGLFTVELDVPQDAFNGQALWLRVQVNGQWLSPRQELLPVPYALSLRPGATIEGDSYYGLSSITTNSYGLRGESSSPSAGAGVIGINTGGVGDGIQGSSNGRAGIFAQGDGPSSHGGYFSSTNADGVYIDSAGRHGVNIHSANEHGIYIEGTTSGDAIYINGAAGRGIHIEGAGAHGVDVASAGQNGVQVYSAGGMGVRVVSAGADGVRVDSANWSGVYVASAGYDAIRVQTAGQDGLRIFDTVGRDYIRAGSDADPDFRVLKDGEVRSDVGFNTPANDFAEMMDVVGEITSYEPGDVLIVSDARNRAVALSSTPYSRAVIGVYSTAPGFVGGRPVSDDDQTRNVPVAILGIVPCKVSAENGPIRRGDLLVTSSTAGHAMRADNPPPGTILGKALEPLNKGTGTILVLITPQ